MASSNYYTIPRGSTRSQFEIQRSYNDADFYENLSVSPASNVSSEYAHWTRTKICQSISLYANSNPKLGDALDVHSTFGGGAAFVVFAWEQYLKWVDCPSTMIYRPLHLYSANVPHDSRGTYHDYCVVSADNIDSEGKIKDGDRLHTTLYTIRVYHQVSQNSVEIYRG